MSDDASPFSRDADASPWPAPGADGDKPAEHGALPPKIDTETFAYQAIAAAYFGIV